MNLRHRLFLAEGTASAEGLRQEHFHRIQERARGSLFLVYSQHLEGCWALGRDSVSTPMTMPGAKRTGWQMRERGSQE